MKRLSGETGSPAPCRCRTSLLLMSLYTPGTKYHLLTAATLLLFLLLCFFFSFPPSSTVSLLLRIKQVILSVHSPNIFTIDIFTQRHNIFRVSIMTLDILQKRNILNCRTCFLNLSFLFTHFHLHSTVPS